MNSYGCIYEFILSIIISDMTTSSSNIVLYFSCGLPCEHVLRITNEIRHEMIHVQNWIIYASHYDDDSTELGFELKKEQLHYKQYGEQMGVPVTEDIVCRAKRPSVDDIFPYLFEGTLIDDYNQAKFIEQNNNCIREWHERVVTDASAQMPDTNNTNSDLVSPVKLLTGSADDFFSDEILR